MDLHADTLHALDWAAVLDALAQHARTSLGREAVPSLPLHRDLHAVRTTLDLTDEVLLLEADGGWVPISEVSDCREELVRAAKGGVLTVDELRGVGTSLTGLDGLGAYLATRETPVPQLEAMEGVCRVDGGVLDALHYAFDDLGQLSARTYPELGTLRDRIAGLHTRIEATLRELVTSDTLGDALQDRYVTTRGDRYVVPIKANFKRKDMGIVHAVSGSGQTAFIEPHQVVELNNQLRMAEAELQSAERRILTQLSGMVGRVADRAQEGLKAATVIDLAVARAGLARQLDAHRPVVTDQGHVNLIAARHPVLALRDVDVVPNDLTLGPDSPLLIVSGPNTGGKTVALKTLGLCALLVRLGCFVPADEDSRIDLFHDVVALVGDHQTVHGDHSSFSSHVLALNRMLSEARPGCLYLVDEIASGTDPQQGAALAHAVLEAFVAAGARGLVTTHFSRLKTLSAMDDRFGIAALQFHNGQPTYRLVAGSHGDSHALEIAEHIGVPASVLARAEALLGEGERDLAELLASVDAERVRADEAARQAEQHAAELAALKRSVARREAELTKRAADLEQEHAQAFLQRLKRAEKAIGGVVATLQANPSHARVQAAHATLDALKGLASEANHKVADAAPAASPPTPDANKPLGVGDRVRLKALGSTGEVLQIKGSKVTVKAGTLTLRLKPDELVRLGGPSPAPAPKPPPSKKGRSKRSPPKEDVKVALTAAMRHGSNTLDLRGKRVDEGLDEVEMFIDQATMRGMDVVFLLHGHGTGAMKKAVRQWVRTAAGVAQWSPAAPDQGGDAYTVLALP